MYMHIWPRKRGKAQAYARVASAAKYAYAGGIHDIIGENDTHIQQASTMALIAAFWPSCGSCGQAC